MYVHQYKYGHKKCLDVQISDLHVKYTNMNMAKSLSIRVLNEHKVYHVN